METINLGAAMAAGYIVFFGGDGTPATNAVYCNSETDGTMNFFELLGETGVGGIQKAILIDGVEKFVRIFIRRVYPYRCDKIKSDYVKQLMDYGKKFLIIGNMNAITYKEIFPYIKNNQLWYGPSISSGDRKFYVPDNYPLNAAGCGIDDNGKRYIKVKGVRWFTNIPHEKRNTPLDLYKKYNPTDYPKYDNYDAIEVSKTCEIPEDYNGVMGVPITFLDKYCPTQFEIVDAREVALHDKQKNKQTYLIKDADGSVNGKNTYARICIKRVS